MLYVFCKEFKQDLWALAAEKSWLTDAKYRGLHMFSEVLLSPFNWAHTSDCGTYQCAGGLMKTVFNNASAIEEEYKPIMQKWQKRIAHDFVKVGLFEQMQSGSCECGRFSKLNEWFKPTQKLLDAFDSAGLPRITHRIAQKDFDGLTPFEVQHAQNGRLMIETLAKVWQTKPLKAIVRVYDELVKEESE